MEQGGLSGVHVAEYGGYAVAHCGKLLADMGAEVVKIEGPEGDKLRDHGPFPGDVPDKEQSGTFLFLNTNKLGVTLNPRAKTGKEVLHTLLRTCDVFIHDKSPSVAEKLGLTYEMLSKVNPRLVVTAITPYGSRGAYKDYKGYDLNILAAGGAMNSGSPDREPLKHTGSQGYIQAGVHGAAATVVALLARDMTGRGQAVDISAASIWPLFQGVTDISAYVQGQPARRSGFRRANMVYPFQISQVKDGYILMIAIQGFQWKKFLELVGGGKIPDWYVNDPRFKDRYEMGRKYADELDERLRPWLMSHTKEEIFALCRENHIPFAPVYTVDEVVHHPHLNERGFFAEVEQPGRGKLQCPGRPFVMSKTPWKIRRPAPTLGQHNREVFHGQLGYPDEELAKMRRVGVI